MKVLLALLALSAMAAAQTCNPLLSAWTSSATAGPYAVDVTGCTAADAIAVYHNNLTTGGDDKVIYTAGAQALVSGTPTVGGVESVSLTRAYTGSALALPQHGSYFIKVGSASAKFNSPCSAAGRGVTAYKAPTFKAGANNGAGGVAGASGLFSDAGKTGLRLTFDVDGMDNGVAFEFLYGNSRGDARCGADYNGGTTKNARGTDFDANRKADGVDNNGAWTLEAVNGATCQAAATFQYKVNDFNKALTNCGWTRDEQADHTDMTTTVLITSARQGSVIRKVLYSQQLETAVQLGIRFLTNVSATSETLRVFGPRIQYSTMVKQVFDPIGYCVSMGVLTSLQGPYQLSPNAAATFTAFTGHNWVDVSSNAGMANYVANVATKANLNDDLKYKVDSWGALTASHLDTAGKGMCLNNALQASDYSSNTSTYEPCNQYWFVKVCKPCADGFNDDKNLNLGWTMSFSVGCQASFTGACGTPQDPTVTVQWNTVSDNYCPRIIDTESATATLKCYEKSTNGVDNEYLENLAADGGMFLSEQSQFVFGTRSYFETVVESSIKLEDVEYERISMNSGAAAALPDCARLAGSKCLYEREAFATPSTWFKDAAAFPAVRDAAISTGLASTNDFEVNKNSQKWGNVVHTAGTTDGDLKRAAQFQFIWNEHISGASGDEPSATAIHVDMRVRYADQSSKRLSNLQIRLNPVGLLATPDAMSAEARVGISAPTSAGAPPAASDAGAAAVSTQTIAIGAAAVGGVALVAAGAAVAMRKARKGRESNTNVESVQLGGSASTTQMI